MPRLRNRKKRATRGGDGSRNAGAGGRKDFRGWIEYFESHLQIASQLSHSVLSRMRVVFSREWRRLTWSWMNEWPEIIVGWYLMVSFSAQRPRSSLWISGKQGLSRKITLTHTSLLHLLRNLINCSLAADTYGHSLCCSSTQQKIRWVT